MQALRGQETTFVAFSFLIVLSGGKGRNVLTLGTHAFPMGEHFL